MKVRTAHVYCAGTKREIYESLIFYTCKNKIAIQMDNSYVLRNQNENLTVSASQQGKEGVCFALSKQFIKEFCI